MPARLLAHPACNTLILLVCTSSVACGGLSTSATTDAGADATRRAIDSGADVVTLDTTISPLAEASADDVSEAPTGKPDATTDASVDAGFSDWDAACLRDGGGKPGQCCAGQSDCSSNPFDEICCDPSHVCVTCITMR